MIENTQCEAVYENIIVKDKGFFELHLPSQVTRKTISKLEPNLTTAQMINNLTNTSFDGEERNVRAECFTPSDNEKIKTIQMTAYVITVIAGLTGNVLVSLIIFRNKKMRTSANYFILNMSISDILFLLIIMPRKIYESFAGFRGWLIKGIVGEITCKLVYFTQDITVAVSIQSIARIGAMATR